MKTGKITGALGYELKHSFKTETVGALETVVLSGNNEGAIIGYKVNAGNDDVPAVKEKLVESFTVPTGTSAVQENLLESFTIPGRAPAVKEKLVESFTVPTWSDGVKEKLVETYELPEPTPAVKEKLVESFDVSEISEAGDISVFYNSSSPTLVSVALTDTSGDIANKIANSHPSGYTVTAGATAVTIEKDTAGANAIPLSISFGTTDVTSDERIFTAGAELITNIIAGNISIFFNSATPTNIAIASDDTLSGIYSKLAAQHSEYTLSSSGGITIEKNTTGVQAIPLSISLGTTGLTVDSTTLTEGTDDYGNITPGNISVFFNSASPTTVAIARDDLSGDIADKIVALETSGYTMSNVEDAISIENNLAQYNAIPLTISFGTTGVTANSISRTAGHDEHGSIVPGNISVFYNSASPTTVAIGTEDSASDISDKIVINAIEGYTVTNEAGAVNILKTASGVNAIPLSISFGTTGVTENTKTLTPGANYIGAIVPGDISVFYNIAGATLVPIARDDLATNISDKIIALCPITYTATNETGAVSIEKKIAGANAIPLTISFGTTGVTEDTKTLTPGANLIHGGGSAKATSVKLQYSIDTRQALNAGTAVWNDIVTTASSAAYAQYVYAHPISAVRANVLTAASESTCDILIRTAK